MYHECFVIIKFDSLLLYDSVNQTIAHFRQTIDFFTSIVYMKLCYNLSKNYDTI